MEEKEDKEERKEGNKPEETESKAERGSEAKTEEEGRENDDYKELNDRYLRLAAEFDNYKKRSARDIEGAKAVGKAEIAAKILPIIDEFELALESMEMKSEHEKGIALVFSNFYDVLKKEGLQEIDSEGRFDPYKHEIILTKESKEKEGTILEVVRKGYSLNGIMLRPASVIVSKETRQEEKKENR